MSNNILILLVFFVLTFNSCGTVKNAHYSKENQKWENTIFDSSKQAIHTLYLIGDSGEIDDKSKRSNDVVDAMDISLRKEKSETSLVFLGDNIYPKGLSPIDSEERLEEEKILNAQLSLAESHKGKTYFIPGNHDWNHYSAGGKEYVLRQEEYVEKFSKNVYFFPNNACGDPVIEEINDALVFIFLDTQWWLQDWTKENEINQGCKIQTREALLTNVENIFNDFSDRQIIVLMHHPIKSNGTHGGYFGLKSHIFPFTEFIDNLWIPLPVIGSIHPILRKTIGHPQDITNKKNQALVYALENIAKTTNANVVFATGHDHGMQYFDDGNIKHIVSGAGGKTDYVKKGGDADYARQARGYTKILFFENNESWVEYYKLDNKNNKAILDFRTMIHK